MVTRLAAVVPTTEADAGLRLEGMTLPERSAALFRACGVVEVTIREARPPIEPPLPTKDEAVFILPANHALTRPSTMAALAARLAQSDAPGFVPTFRGEPGRPLLLRAQEAARFLRQDHRSDCAEALTESWFEAVPVADANILFSVTPATLPEAERRLKRLDVPDSDEALALMELHGADSALLAHVRGVAEAALAMGRALNANGSGLDLGLLESAALLHDMAKGHPRHAAAGAAILADLGFPRLADIVAVHQDIAPDNVARVTERELVYLADKYVGGATRMSLRQRFAAKLAGRAADPAIRENIQRRLDHALAMQRLVEGAAGKNIQEILGVPG